ncbi:MAG: DALR domain-containing protein, partial [Arsenophonus sp. ET-DL12-MAG3]
HRLYIALRNTNVDNVKFIKDEKFKIRFMAAMNDDFNTPKAYSVLFDLAKEINRFKDNNMTIANELAAQLRQLANILGLLTKNSEE